MLFDDTDLEPTPFVAIEGTSAYTMTLTAKPGSYAWYGTTTIRVEPYQHISLYVNSPSFTWNQQ
ncbi:hypothetical protein D3C71_1923230 [compost metagenome]